MTGAAGLDTGTLMNAQCAPPTAPAHHRPSAGPASDRNRRREQETHGNRQQDGNRKTAVRHVPGVCVKRSRVVKAVGGSAPCGRYEA